MAIEDLPDTALFQKVRIPLSDFVVLPESLPGKGDAKGVIPLEHPSAHFRSCQGFYLWSSFYERFHARLKPRPLKPSESFLFVWTLKKSCVWNVAQHHFEGKNQPVPWWVIRPFLAYATSGNQRTLLVSEYEAPFFMEAKEEEGQSFREIVSLSLHFGAIHSEWRLQLLAPEKDYRCHEGQSFLSVA